MSEKTSAADVRVTAQAFDQQEKSTLSIKNHLENMILTPVDMLIVHQPELRSCQHIARFENVTRNLVRVH